MHVEFICYIFAENSNNIKYIAMEKSNKRQRFEKVAGNRVQKILDTIQLLKNCSNRNNYEYSESDVELMFSEIAKALKDSRSAFLGELHKANKKGFTFNS